MNTPLQGKTTYQPPTTSPAAAIWERIKLGIDERAKIILSKVSTGEELYNDSEDENGRLFYELAGYFFRYESVNNQFMVYDSKKWRPDFWQLAEAAAAEVGLIRQQMLIYLQPHELKTVANFVRKSRSAPGIRSTLFFAKSRPEITSVLSDFDIDPDLVNTPAGVIDLSTGKILPHSPEFMLSKITNYSPEKSTGEMWKEFLSNITCSIEELELALQRFMGSGLSGRPQKQKIALFHGGGANGKGVLVETVLEVMGDYAKTTAINTFQKTKFSGNSHSEDLASLRGARFVGTSEPNASIQLDEGKIKLLSGGDTISVSHKHGRAFNYRPCFSICIATNHRPRINGRDDGIWRRMWLFPFNWKIPAKEQDPNYREKLLQAEGPHIMQWLIEGARKWTTGSWGYWPSIEAATAFYKDDEDSLKDFLEEETIPGENNTITKKDLRTAYIHWAERTAEKPMSIRAFKEAMLERDYIEARQGKEGTRIWKGLKLKI